MISKDKHRVIVSIPKDAEDFLRSNAKSFGITVSELITRQVGWSLMIDAYREAFKTGVLILPDLKNLEVVIK